jgi:uncharacterized protein YlxW (UPF0749 family)
MSLLVDVMTNTLDEGYAQRAARVAADPHGQPAGRRQLTARALGAATLLVLGVVTGIAVDSVRERAAASAGLRAGLAGQVAERRAETDDLAGQAAALQAEVAATRGAALRADAAGRAAADRLDALELASATMPVSGPGIVLTLDDAPSPDEVGGMAAPRGGSPSDGRVLDRDLQEVVNGLWAAGAEAIAVNDVRLSSRAAIRSAGEAVLVDFRPLSPPYVIEAVGAPRDLEVDFLDGPSGRRLSTLSEFTGIEFTLEREDDLVLPAASEPQLRAADPVGEPLGGRP